MSQPNHVQGPVPPVSPTPELFYPHIFPGLKFHLDICSKLGASPLRWDLKSGRVVLEVSNFWLQRLHTSYITIYLGAMTWGLSRYWRSISFPKLIISLFVIFGTTMFATCRESMATEALEFARTLNGIPLLEGKTVGDGSNPCSGVQFYRKLEKWLIILGTLTAALLPSVELGYLINPCFTPYWGAILFLDGAGVCHLHSSGGVILLMTFELYWYVNFSFNAIFTATVFVSLGVNFTIHSLQRLKRTILDSRMGQVSKISTLRQTLKLFSEYRHLQLFVIQFNVACQGVLFPVILAGCTGLLILGLVVCIKMGVAIFNDIETWTIPVGAFDSFLVVFLLTTLASKVFLKSGGILERLKSGLGSNKGRYCRRVIRSLQPMKICFSSNFVDNETPLVILNFAFNQTVSLLLMAK